LRLLLSGLKASAPSVTNKQKQQQYLFHRTSAESFRCVFPGLAAVS
jgi:hypothetical protein